MIYGFVNTSLPNEGEQVSLLRAYAKKHRLGELQFIRTGNISDLTGYSFNPGDILLVDNISSIGSSLRQIRFVLQSFAKSRINFTSVIEDYSFGTDINFEFAVKALDFVIKLRKDLISRATVQALEAVRSGGKVLGRPKGRKSSVYKLSGKEKQINELLAEGYSKVEIAKRLGITRTTLYSFLQNLESETKTDRST